MDLSLLKIGNWVEYRGKPFQIHWLKNNEIGLLDNLHLSEGNYDRTVNSINVKPLSLNESHLLKFGFSDRRNGSYEYNNIVIWLEKLQVNTFGLWHGDTIKMFDVSVQFVHQVQNLISIFYRTDVTL